MRAAVIADQPFKRSISVQREKIGSETQRSLKF